MFAIQIVYSFMWESYQTVLIINNLNDLFCIYYFFSSKRINFYLVWNQFSFFIQTSVTINININEIFMKLVLILRLFILQTGISFCVWQVLNL